MTDPKLSKIIGVTDEELRFASRHLAAASEAMRQSRHFACGSDHLAMRMLAIEISIREMHKDIAFIRAIAANPANQVSYVPKPETADPDLLRAIADATRSPLPETP